MFFKKSVRRQTCNFIKKETLAQVFSCKFYEIFKNTFFTKHLRATASEKMFFKISVLKNFANFAGKNLFWSLVFNTVTGLNTEQIQTLKCTWEENV